MSEKNKYLLIRISPRAPALPSLNLPRTLILRTLSPDTKHRAGE